MTRDPAPRPLTGRYRYGYLRSQRQGPRSWLVWFVTTSNRAAIVFYRERGSPSAIPRLACPRAAPFGHRRGWLQPTEALKTLIRPLISFN
ncbi:hypothetical protein CRG98_029566 [Punica granatum]|uniref:Uncharacterized protein n=1 Tax=Punica granatum TaxID=22663 RepID=A0A2I0J2A8_PUNGR|nr:hypothetical protein CRG98_029566 [Punica granatum]